MSVDGARVTRLDEWIRGKEDESVEFKEWKSRTRFDDLGKYCAALANEGGGKIIIGVSDARPRQIVGTRGFDQPEQIRRSLCEKIPLRIDFEEILHPDCSPGSRVLVFEVPTRPNGMPIKYDGRYWMRKEDSLIVMSEERLRDILLETERDFSAEICPGLALEDLDADAIENFRGRWIIKSQRAEQWQLAERLGTLTVEQLLADAEARVEGGLTYAALILFGGRPAIRHYLPQGEVIFEYRASDSSGPAQERLEFRRGFFCYCDALWEQINLRNEKQDFREGLFVAPIATFSERTVREAILNAVSHRNYQLGGNVFIRQFPRRLEIDSPGGFPRGITVENILDRQKPRNRRIAQVLTRCGLVERSGQGMNLIYEELIKQSKPVPNFDRTDDLQVGLTLHGTVQDLAFVRFVEKVSNETTSTFSTHDWIVMEAAAKGHRAPKGHEDRVARLVDLGVIERGRGRSYMLSRRFYEFTGERGAYTRKKGLDRDHNLALILKHLRENREKGAKLDELCQVLPSLPRTHVQSLLRTLKRRGEVYPIGQRRAGVWYAAASVDSDADPDAESDA